MRGTRFMAVTAATAAVVTVAACGGSSSTPGGGGGGGGGGGKTSIAVWEGYADTEGAAFKGLVSQFNSSHPKIHVSALYVNNDYSLQKVSTAVRGGTPPDISYLYGSWSPNIVKIPAVVDLTSVVKQPSANWSDFWQGEQQVATVNGKVIGIPALVDNLAIVYNSRLFRQAGLNPPSANWTWNDFRAAAKKLTNPSKKQFGWSIPADASEDTVWHWEAMLWEAGGDILNSSNTKAAFDSPQGVEALTMLKDMAVDDKSVYIDTTNSKYMDVFNAGKIGMLVTGPWDLSTITVPHGVQIMPTFSGSPAGHQSISGPDNWVIFNNSDARKQAAITFVRWLTAPSQVRAFSLKTGDLPILRSVGQDQSVINQMNTSLPGVKTFISNLSNVKKARPQVASYPAISQALGNAIVAVLLGKQSPQAALNQAAQAANAALAGS